METDRSLEIDRGFLVLIEHPDLSGIANAENMAIDGDRVTDLQLPNVIL
jgi:hypothetical protein